MPFGSSLLVVIGLLLLKRAQNQGISSWTAMILLSWACVLVFSPLLLLGGTWHGALWYQPALVGLLFLAGQFFTLLAVKWGDVSIAAPVLGVKVLLVPVGSMLIVAEVPELRIWVAAAIAMIGIAFVQQTDATVVRSRILTAVGFALAGALSMTCLDLLIQRWAPAWGAGYFLPLAFLFCAVFATAFVPAADPPRKWLRRPVAVPLFVGSVLMAVQAIGMTFTLATFGDAARVNIVYSMRGLWGVLVTWLLLHRSAVRPEDRPSNRLMAKRLCGALLIALAVIIAVV